LRARHLEHVAVHDIGLLSRLALACSKKSKSVKYWASLSYRAGSAGSRGHLRGLPSICDAKSLPLIPEPSRIIQTPLGRIGLEADLAPARAALRTTVFFTTSMPPTLSAPSLSRSRIIPGPLDERAHSTAASITFLPMRLTRLRAPLLECGQADGRSPKTEKRGSNSSSRAFERDVAHEGHPTAIAASRVSLSLRVPPGDLTWPPRRPTPVSEAAED
jgi:hypothetical protein